MATLHEDYKIFEEEMRGMHLYPYHYLHRDIFEYLGDKIEDKDGALVACSDKEEREEIKNEFLIKKLRMNEQEDLDKKIELVCEMMGSSNRRKRRVTFYYLLVITNNKMEEFHQRQYLSLHNPEGH